MVSHLRPSLVLIVLFTLLTGLAFPLAFTGGAQVLAPYQANGSLIRINGKIIGSALIGQNFTTPGYFHPRPSATTGPDPKNPSNTVPAPYNADGSAASNLGPTSQALLDRIKGDVANDGPKPVPADMVTTSASGLDPDISPANAERQVARVAAARKLTPAQVQAMVDAHTAGRLFGLLGEAHVNVLELNLALDALPASK